MSILVLCNFIAGSVQLYSYNCTRNEVIYTCSTKSRTFMWIVTSHDNNKATIVINNSTMPKTDTSGSLTISVEVEFINSSTLSTLRFQAYEEMITANISCDVMEATFYLDGE